MRENIDIICGPGGNFNDLENIENNPNFVFENDPDFQTVVLFNENGSIINVNSWLECANYVNGGWISDKIDVINGEQIVFIFILISLTLYTVTSYFFNKRS
tara:strand:+ start:43 stop:345 length:303 start_codon:yes stop_codon:yes gene_type:complete